MILFATTVVLTLLPSCDSDERDVQSPGPDPVCTLESPSKVFWCMDGAIESQQDANYERSLSDSFVFSPTDIDSLDANFSGTSVFDSWNKPVEMETLQLLFSDADWIKADFGTPFILINKNTFVRYNVSYSLAVINAVAPADTVIYKGVAQFDVRNENGNWRMTSWNEKTQVPGFATWGYLRGELRKRFAL